MELLCKTGFESPGHNTKLQYANVSITVLDSTRANVNMAYKKGSVVYINMYVTGDWNNCSIKVAKLNDSKYFPHNMAYGFYNVTGNGKNIDKYINGIIKANGEIYFWMNGTITWNESITFIYPI